MQMELRQPVLQNKNPIVLPAAVNINSPRSSDCYWAKLNDAQRVAKLEVGGLVVSTSSITNYQLSEGH